MLGPGPVLRAAGPQAGHLQPAPPPAGHPADRHRLPVHHHGAAGRDHGPDLSRGRGEEIYVARESCRAWARTKPEAVGAMNVLMLAPEPFFQPRGTPISVYFRLRALSDLGHKVDLITYPAGQGRGLSRVCASAARPNLLGLRNIKIGPSLAKLPLDAFMAARPSRRSPGAATTSSSATRRRPSSASLLARSSPRRISTTCTRACRSSSTTSISPIPL